MAKKKKQSVRYRRILCLVRILRDQALDIRQLVKEGGTINDFLFYRNRRTHTKRVEELGEALSKMFASGGMEAKIASMILRSLQQWGLTLDKAVQDTHGFYSILNRPNHDEEVEFFVKLNSILDKPKEHYAKDMMMLKLSMI